MSSIVFAVEQKSLLVSKSNWFLSTYAASKCSAQINAQVNLAYNQNKTSYSQIKDYFI